MDIATLRNVVETVERQMIAYAQQEMDTSASKSRFLICHLLIFLKFQ
jgi:hypothetical protein